MTVLEELIEEVKQGFVWLDKDTNELCMDEPDTDNKTYLPDIIKSFQ